MRRGKRGQVLVIAALAIALTLLATQAYIYGLSRTKISDNHNILGDYILNIEQGSRHVVTASLINVSSGGEGKIFEDNLDRWDALVAQGYRFGQCELNSTLAYQAPYSDGIWLDWGVDGEGISSGYADFSLGLSGRDAEVGWIFAVNITTRLLVSGSYIDLGVDMKEVTVIVELFNEGSPALCRSNILEYLKLSEWENPMILEGYQEIDYGNGTYRYTFTENILGDEVTIRCQVYDHNGIFVKAEATLTSE